MELKIINMENCYGIGKMKEILNFSQANSYLLCAQNGVFKTSFAKSLTDLINSEMPKDNFYPNRESKIEIEFNQKKMLLFFILMMKNLALKTALQILWQNQN